MVIDRWLLPPASAHAAEIDWVLVLVHWLMLALFVGWSAYFVWALVRYRQKRQPEPTANGASSRLAVGVEIGVVIAEGVLLVVIALPIWWRQSAPPPLTGPRTIVVRVIAEQFAWHVHYPGADGRFGETRLALISPENPVGLDRASTNGRDDLVTTGEMHLPLNRLVVVQLSSKDVIHSFGVPAFRVKQDVIPGLASAVFFTPTLLGEFDIACSQLCGLGHYRMRAVIVVESDDAFQRFLAREAALLVTK